MNTIRKYYIRHLDIVTFDLHKLTTIPHPYLNFLLCKSSRISSGVVQQVQFNHKEQHLIPIALTLSSSTSVLLHYGITQCILVKSEQKLKIFQVFISCWFMNTENSDFSGVLLFTSCTIVYGGYLDVAFVSCCCCWNHGYLKQFKNNGHLSLGHRVNTLNLSSFKMMPSSRAKATAWNRFHFISGWLEINSSIKASNDLHHSPLWGLKRFLCWYKLQIIAVKPLKHESFYWTGPAVGSILYTALYSPYYCLSFSCPTLCVNNVDWELSETMGRSIDFTDPYTISTTDFHVVYLYVLTHTLPLHLQLYVWLLYIFIHTHTHYYNCWSCVSYVQF